MHTKVLRCLHTGYEFASILDQAKPTSSLNSRINYLDLRYHLNSTPIGRIRVVRLLAVFRATSLKQRNSSNREGRGIVLNSNSAISRMFCPRWNLSERRLNNRLIASSPIKNTLGSSKRLLFAQALLPWIR